MTQRETVLMNKRGLYRQLLVTVLAGLLTATTVAAQDTIRVYTPEHPLVYEDVWDLWPYSFLNENGQPDGFNIELIRILLDEMKIPYVIKLKSKAETLQDLREGVSDLTLGIASGFHDDHAHFNANPITLFTQSVVTPKGQPVEVKNFRDLANTRVIVKDSSFCHHLMLDYGWEANAISVEDIREAIQTLSSTEEGQIVWNTLSLKWLMHRYHTDNLELTPVNMPHGEYKFMSNDTRLLRRLDDTYARLYAEEAFVPIQNKWFYPERLEEPTMPTWLWYVIGVVLFLLVVAVIYAISERLQIAALNSNNRRLNKRLALIIETSHVRVWTYNVETKQITWYNESGHSVYHCSLEEFAQRYSVEDFEHIKHTLYYLANTQKPKGDKKEEEEVTLHVKACDHEDGNDNVRDFTMTISVLRRRRDGAPLTIIGMNKDITEELERKQLSDERTLRYWAIFNTDMAGIIYFSKDGVLADINPMACQMFQCEHDTIVERHIHIGQILDIGTCRIDQLDGYNASQIRGDRYLSIRLRSVRNDRKELVGVFAICRDISNYVSSVHGQKEVNGRLAKLRNTLREYDTDINGVLNESDVRLVSYSPATHTLTIYQKTGKVQHALTQTRCMTLVDDRSKKMAMRLLTNMDARTRKDIHADIWTTLRTKGGYQLCLTFDLTPRCDDEHGVEYLGLCRDLSELRDIEQRIEQATAKVQEVENAKNSFVKNMVQEIRQPMNTIVDYVMQFDPQAPTADEPILSKGIMDNADKLLHLIDNILYLSRLEAHMVEFQQRPCNFAELFEAHCASGWTRHQNSATKYIVENPYEQLVVDIDPDCLEHAISQITANAAQHTHNGAIRARYDYIGQRLVISIDDTGEGIPPDVLENINNQQIQNYQSVKGLGLLICRELLHQMNGTLEVSSEQGSGTTVYITLPCHATAIRRKKTSS